MTYYFVQVRLRTNEGHIAYAIQRIRKGNGNQARNWANQIIHKTALYKEESVPFRAAFPGRNYNMQIHQDGAPAEPATNAHGIQRMGSSRQI